jgi:hypothetical protein
MKRQYQYFSAIIVLVVVTFVTAFPVPVKAAFSISDFNPKSVVNDVDNAITIEGVDLATDVQVKVGDTPVPVTYYSFTKLIIRISSGFTAGEYSISIINPSDSTSLSFSDPLMVTVPTPTPIPSSTATPLPYARPQIVIDADSLSVDAIRYGQDFNLNMSLDNAGGSTAYGLQVTFTSSDLVMLKNGGVIAAGDLGVVGKANFSQTMTAAAALFGVNRVSVEMDVSYSDDKGTTYSDKFPLIFPVAVVYSGGSGSAATATPTGLHRPQLVVMGTQTDVDPLQPGVQFTLSMSVQNVGNVAAKGVTMIIGGGSASGSGSGTPQAGVSAGSGEFTNFAPVGSSNIQSLGDLKPGVVLTATQKLVVNVSTNPGAYPMIVTFSYLDDQGNPVNDAQVITLLVYNLPVVDVSFYQPVGTLVAGQPNALPLQVVSLGKRTSVLGKMTVESSGGTVQNGEGLVGSLDPGGYFTLDAMLTPNGPGPIDLTITIDYTDDFNQARTITQTLTVDVTDMGIEPTPDMSISGGGSEVSTAPESFWQKAWRFILGLFGLDSGATSTTPSVEQPTVIPIPVKPGGGGGGGKG